MENDKDPWENYLTEKERNILSEKIMVTEGDTVSNVFKSMLRLWENDDIESSVISIRNVTDVLGGHRNSPAWQQIKSFAQVYPKSNHLVQIFVKDRAKFVEALQEEKDAEGRDKYAVNDFFDKKFANHPNDSIRQRTEFSTDYPIHLANDDSTDDTAYFVHFDPASPYFRTTTRDGTESFWESLPGLEHLKELRWAAEQHEHVSIPPNQLRDYLKNTGQTTE